MAVVTGGGGGIGGGRSYAVMAKDIMDGYITLNPLVLKKFDASSIKGLHLHLLRLQTTIRAGGVDIANQEALRLRNQRLQRINQARAVLEMQAKLQKILLV